MIVAFKHEAMGGSLLGDFYEDIKDFARNNFEIKVSNEGYVTINGRRAEISYSIGENQKDYTPEEAMSHFISTNEFKEHAKANFWTVYKTEKII